MRNWVLHMLDMRCFSHIQVEVHRGSSAQMSLGTSLVVVRWLKLCLPMQEVLVGWIPPGWETKILPCGVSKKKRVWSLESKVGGQCWLGNQSVNSSWSYGIRRSSVKESACNAGNTGDAGLILGLGRSPGRGNGNPLQYSCLETLSCMDRGAWWATGLGVTESDMTDHMCTPRKYIWWREGTKPLTTGHNFSVWLTHHNPHPGWEYGTQPIFSQLTV